MLTFTFLKEEVRLPFSSYVKQNSLCFSFNVKRRSVKDWSTVHGLVFHILISFGKISSDEFERTFHIPIEHSRVMMHSHPTLNFRITCLSVSGLVSYPVLFVWRIHYVIPLVDINMVNDNGLYKYKHILFFPPFISISFS